VWKSSIETTVAFDGGAEQGSSLEQIQAEVTESYKSLAQCLLRYLLCLTRDFDRAQEAVQEVFLRYYEYRLKGGEVPDGRGWFYRVARNYVVDQTRTHRPDRHVSLNEVLLKADDHDCPHEALARTETLDLLFQVLSARELECLELRVEGFKYKEIAEILGIEPGTVGAILAQGLKKMRALRVKIVEESGRCKTP
jgi:RNA polymerase sigma-70 factor (ECF subfamily)